MVRKSTSIATARRPALYVPEQDRVDLNAMVLSANSYKLTPGTRVAPCTLATQQQSILFLYGGLQILFEGLTPRNCWSREYLEPVLSAIMQQRECSTERTYQLVLAAARLVKVRVIWVILVT